MKKIFTYILILLIVVALFGCQQEVEKIETRRVIDCLGRSVEVPLEINKVGAIYAISGHTSVLLGEGEKIVSVTSGLKRDLLLTQMVPSILEATEPKNGGSINIEELLKDKPDVIFINTDIALNERETDKLDKFHIPYLAITFDSIEEQQYMVKMIGEVYHQEEKAQLYIDYYNEMVNKIENRTQNIDEQITVFHSINEATRTDPKGSMSEEWFTIAGFDLVSTQGDLKFVSNDYYASLEQILAWDPEVIFVNENGVDDYILKDSKWQSLKAVNTNQVYMLPVGITRWGHPNSLEIPLVMLYTSKMMYPDLFEDMDLENEMKYFYKTFFDLDVTDEMIKEILDGDGMRIRKDDRE